MSDISPLYTFVNLYACIKKRVKCSIRYRFVYSPWKPATLAVGEALTENWWSEQGLARSVSPTAALQEAHLTLSICCDTQVFRQPPRVSSHDRLIMTVPSSAYLSQCSNLKESALHALASHTALGMSLKPWQCCFHFFPKCSSLITYSHQTWERLSCSAQGQRRYRESAGRVVPATMQEQPRGCRGKDLRKSREREESRHLLFSF